MISMLNRRTRLEIYVVVWMTIVALLWVAAHA